MDIQKEYRGFLLAALIGLSAYYAAGFLPSVFNSVLLALLAGMVIGNAVHVPASFQSGIGFTSGKMLELSILFLAFNINYGHITQLGWQTFVIVAVVLLGILLITFYLAQKAKCPGSVGWLVGFGTAICGSSAIAALAPTVAKEKEDVGISMAVVNLFGAVGMILFPIVFAQFDVSSLDAGLLIGGTLHSVGNVAGAGYAMSNEVGEAAITVKLARVAMLSPGLIIFNYMVNRNHVSDWKEHFSLPWYLWGFIGITIITSVADLPTTLLQASETAGKIVLTIAMAAIGLKVGFKQLIQNGQKGLLFGLVIFAIQIALIWLGIQIIL